MVASAVFITDIKGKIIISRNYRGDIPMTVAEKFSQYLAETDEDQMTPVVNVDGITFCYIQHNNLYLMSCTKRNANATMMLLFLYKLVETFTEYVVRVAGGNR